MIISKSPRTVEMAQEEAHDSDFEGIEFENEALHGCGGLSGAKGGSELHANASVG